MIRRQKDHAIRLRARQQVGLRTGTRAECLERRQLLSAAFDPAMFRHGIRAFDAIEVEANNTPSTAMPISVAPSPYFLTGMLSPGGGDADYYSFTLPARSGVFLDVDAYSQPVSPTSGFADVKLTVLAADGTTVLASNDTADDFFDFDLNYTSDSIRGRDPAIYVDLNPGSYYLRVTGAFASETGRYDLKTFADDNFTSTPPVLNSLPGAADTLLLDVDGNSATNVWGTFSVPAYDFNGNPAEWTPGERLAVKNIWRVVAEDFAPFNISVTTSYGGSFNDGVGFRQVVTNSDGSQVGRTGQLGAAITSSYATGGATNNVGFTFADNFASVVGVTGTSGEIGGKAVELGNQVSQEFGHALGLRDYGGSNPQRDGIMHAPDVGLNRERWKSGNTTTEGGATPVAQDDLAVIGNATNTFGFRTDDHGGTTATATAMPAFAGGIAVAKGVVGNAADVDFFRFATSSASKLLTGYAYESVYVGNLDIDLSLYNAAGTRIMRDPGDPATRGASLGAYDLPAGTYYMSVGSRSSLGEVGGYTLEVRQLSAEPGTPDLLPASDTGLVNNDDLTSLDNSSPARALQFSVGNTVPGATVTVYVDGVPVGSAVAAGTTTVVTTSGTYDIPDSLTGLTRRVVARQTQPGLAESLDFGGALSLRIETTPPTADVVDVSPDPRTNGVSSVNVTFNRQVTGVTISDFTLTRDGGPNLLTAAQTVTGGGASYTVGNLASIAQAKGTYTLTLVAAGSGITENNAGAPLAENASDTWVQTNAPPMLTSFTIDPPLSPRGYTFNLTAEAQDAEGDAFTIRFYRESNNSPGLQTDGFTADALIGSGTSATTVVSLPASQPAGTYTYYAQATDAGGAASDARSATHTVSVDTTPPTVDLVFVSSGQWATPFRSFLASSTLGEAAFGFRIPASAQTDELPWINLQEISIRFSEPVKVAADDLVVRGVNVGTYPMSPTTPFRYDEATRTATWTLAAPIANDKILLDLDADAGTGVTDTVGNRLDGEWTNPVAPAISGDSFPSGNGTGGGDFRFRLDVLPGDATRSGGSVIGSDVTIVRNTQNFAPGSSGYTIFRDDNGSGTIVGSDVTAVRNRQGLSLPAGEPSVPTLRRAATTAMAVATPSSELTRVTKTTVDALTRKRLTDGLI